MNPVTELKAIATKNIPYALPPVVGPNILAATAAKIVKWPPSQAIERATAMKNNALEWTV